MRFRYGAVPENPDFLPEKEGWFDIHEPGPWRLQLIAMPIAFVLLLLSAGLLYLVFPRELVFIRPLGISTPSTMSWILVAILILLIPVHELFHVVCQPECGFSSDSVIGLWLSKALVYAHYESSMSRNRFLLVVAMPYISAGMNKIFAITTRGLETISAEELAALPGVTVDQIAYRRVFASCHASLTPLLSIRTVDDIFLYAVTWQEMDRGRHTLSILREASAQLDLSTALAVCEQIRPIRKPPRFSVTANFVGKRNYTTAEIKQACAAGIIERQRWAYSEDDARADLNVRVFIEGESATVGVRLGARSLSRRLYKQEHVPGSLKPAVAAALLALADVSPGAQILDPCCGAGTILIEAEPFGVTAWGGDIDPRAVVAAHLNAATANSTVRIQRWDARALPIADRSVARVISNLPWGRAVSTAVSLQTLYQEIGEEIERILIPGGKAVLLTNLPDLVQFKRLRCERQLEISLFGQTPTIMAWTG